MEIKQRESTLEVLRRLQAKNKKPVPSMYERPPVKIKVEDILDVYPEPRSIMRIKITGKNSEIISLLNQIKSIEKQMKSGSNYFDYYYDLKRKEEDIAKIYDSLESKEGLTEEAIKKIEEIKKKLKKIG